MRADITVARWYGTQLPEAWPRTMRPAAARVMETSAARRRGPCRPLITRGDCERSLEVVYEGVLAPYLALSACSHCLWLRPCPAGCRHRHPGRPRYPCLLWNQYRANLHCRTTHPVRGDY